MQSLRSDALRLQNCNTERLQNLSKKNPNAKAKPNRATTSNESDIDKYFSDSAPFASKQSKKVYARVSPKGRPNAIAVSKNLENKENVPAQRITPLLIDLTAQGAKLKNLGQTSTNSSVEIPSRICTQDRCKLASWGLPPSILQKYESRGLSTMFPWQVECLSNRELLENNRNLVYSAPTSAGKTLVSEILVIKTILERRKKVIFILPFVSVVREKMYYFQDLLTDSGFRVEGFMGGCAPVGGFAATDVAIATIEKANSLINQLMEENNLVNLGAVVIDELHLIGDPYRGYLLELLLTKLKYMSLKNDGVRVQLIGMSATLPNLGLLADWLDAELYKTDFRPIPLNELCKIGPRIYDNKMKNLRTLKSLANSNDSDDILQLCLETISDGHSVLIFCPTKNWCEKLAQQVAGAFRSLGRESTDIGRILREQLSMEAIIETLEQLKRSPSGLDAVLRGTVSFGVAFHHAGLTMDERDVIEGSFRSGALRVLTATSTLSSGVNLPARRVIIRSLMFHGRPLDSLTYKQMIGRAGRMGKDTAGESIIVCKPNETKAVTALLSSDLQPIESCLEGSEPLIRALLEAVASEVAYTASDIDLYTKSTLLSFSSADLIEESTREAMKYLVDNELLMMQTTTSGDERWVATPLGKACLAASMPPTDGLFLFDELQKARRCFVLDTELHVIYLVTPLNSSNQIGQIDWIVFLDVWKSISESERRVGQLIGVQESFVMTAIRGAAKPGKILNVHKRFYTALALHELVREVSLADVCRKYGCCRGVIQGLQQSASTFAGMITQFCKKLGWSCMELLIGQFQARLQFGVCRDLLDLLRLPMLNGLRARSLYKEGITSVAELAVANELDVERALHKALPFESGKEHDGEHEMDAAKRNKMRSVFVTGRDGLTPNEAAIILVREARTLVQNELGVDDLQWKQRQQSMTEDASRNSRILNSGSVNQSSSIGPPGNVTDQRENGEQNDDSGKNVEQTNRVENRVDKESPRPREESNVEGRNGSKVSEASYNDAIFEFSGNVESIQPEVQIGSKTQREMEQEMTVEKVSSQSQEELILVENQVNEENSGSREKVPNIAEPVALQNSGNASKTCEASYDNEIFEFSGTVASMQTEVQTGSKILPEAEEEMPLERDDPQKIGEKLDGVENRVNEENSRREDVPISTNEGVLGNSKNASKICEASYNDDIFEFSGTVVSMQADLETGSKILREAEKEMPLERDDPQKIGEKLDGVEDRVNEENSRREAVPISTNRAAPENSKTASKICEASYTDDIFEFTATLNIEPEPTVGSKSEEIGMKLVESQKIPAPEPKTINGADKPLAMSPAILLRRSDALESNSRSPSMFGDSLNIDSQECNMLEQNVIDSLEISAFGDTIMSEFAASRKQYTPESIVSSETKPTRRSSTGSQRRRSLMNTAPRRSPRISETKDRSKSLIWDDSWDNTNGVIERVDQASMPSNSRTKDARNIKNSKASSKVTIKTDKVRSASTLKSDYEPSLVPKDRIAELRKIAQKRKLTESSSLDRSPIASVLTYTVTRRPSIDSNKSDSDDVVFPSQSLDPCTSTAKNRTKMKLESVRRSRTQRELITRSLKLNEPEEPKDGPHESCAIERVESDSEDGEIPVKRTNALSRTKTIRKVSKAPARKKLIGSVKNPADRTRTKKTSINEPQVVNVASNREKFNLFKQDIVGQRDISLALSCEIFLKDTISIGTKIIGITGADGKKKTKKVDNCVYGNKKLCGIAISWDGDIVHYISFDNTQESKVPVKERLELVTELLANKDLTVRCFAFKETYKILYNCCRIASSCKFLDPKTADWLLDPDHSERSFNALITEYLNEAQFILQRTGAHLGGSGPGLNVKSSVDSEIRATTECALTWHLTGALMQRLQERNPILLQTFKEIEMGTLILLARMELTGLGVSLKSLQELSDVIQREMAQLEKQAYSLAGKQFNFSSSKSVAQVLGLYKGKKVSTNKAVLELCENPISDLVVSWRKLSTTQIKMVFPLLRLAQFNSRIYGNCLTNTVTGRVSMHEPNLQNVPRDFKSHDDNFVISVRTAFVPLTGNVIVSADYCQLELRILAHFSKETRLCKILRKQGDVFKNIAARWYNVTEDNIDDAMRHRTKQLCYGMIYGMGVKTLAETLSVTEDEAKEFLETFMGTYPGIRQWLNLVVEEARKNGYVTTLMERRRFFPALHSPVPSERSQAERQAVNTKVQGSAADIAKKAMVTIDERMRREFPGEPLVLTDVPLKRKLRSRSREPLPRGGYLILQIHDELLYEVNAADLQQVGRIIQESMEQSCQLRVPLPVKLKFGPAWGDLTEFNL